MIHAIPPHYDHEKDYEGVTVSLYKTLCGKWVARSEEELDLWKKRFIMADYGGALYRKASDIPDCPKCLEHTQFVQIKLTQKEAYNIVKLLEFMEEKYPRFYTVDDPLFSAREKMQEAINV